MSKYSKNKPSEYYIYRIYDENGAPINEDEYHSLVNVRSKSFNRSGSIRTTLDPSIWDELLSLTNQGYRAVYFNVSPKSSTLCKLEDNLAVTLDVFEGVDINYIAHKVLSKPFNKIY